MGKKVQNVWKFSRGCKNYICNISFFWKIPSELLAIFLYRSDHPFCSVSWCVFNDSISGMLTIKSARADSNGVALCTIWPTVRQAVCETSLWWVEVSMSCFRGPSRRRGLSFFSPIIFCLFCVLCDSPSKCRPRFLPHPKYHRSQSPQVASP